jgi:hypothetical protein
VQQVGFADDPARKHPLMTGMAQTRLSNIGVAKTKTEL